MDKDMIHIDDLVRGQLSGREEDERAGAWLHMRELLDKNMPAGMPAPFNRRRFGGYMALLSLLAVMVTGGYLATQYPSRPENNQTVPGITSAPNAATHPETHPATKAIPESPAGMGAGETASSSAPATGSAAGKGTGIQTPSTGSYAGAPPMTADDRHTAATGTAGASGTHPTDRNLHDQAPAPQKTDQAVLAAHDDDIDATRIKATQGKIAAVPQDPVATASATLKDQPGGEAVTLSQPLALQNPQQTSNGTAAMASVSQTGQNEPPARPERVVNSDAGAPQVTQAVSAGTNNSSARSNAPTKGVTHDLVTHKDTVQQINLVYRTVIDPLSRARRHVVDTTSVKKMIIEQQELIAKRATPAAHTNTAHVLQNSGNIAPENAVAANTGNDAPTVNAALSKRESRKSGQTFQDMYLNTKFKLSQAPFYLGINAGINGMSSSGTFIPGIQLGLNGELELNEQWSVLAELKYINRFNNGKTIDDPYRSSPSPITEYYHNGSSYIVYQRDSSNHYFNFSTIGTGNLPIMVKYSVNRFFMLAGVDLVYHFRMNAEEIDVPVTGAASRDTLPAGQPPTFLTSGTPSVQLSDLGARLGVGYLLGVGYKATPNLHLDLRLTHTFWDNAATGGAKKVSDQLFRIPSLQFSLGYRLGGTQRTP